MKKFNRIAFTVLLATAGAGAFAQQSGSITSGGLVTPAACNLSLTNGNLNFGTETKNAFLARVDANPNGYVSTTGSNLKWNGNINYGLNVTCGSPTRVALEFLDNNAAVAPTPSSLINPAQTVWYPQPFAVVDTSTNALAGFTSFYNTSLTVNGGTVPGTKLEAVNGSTAWTPLTAPGTGTAHWTSIKPGRTLALAPSANQTSPEAVSTIEGLIGSDHYVYRDYFNNANGSVPYAVNATITLRYY